MLTPQEICALAKNACEWVVPLLQLEAREPANRERYLPVAMHGSRANGVVQPPPGPAHRFVRGNTRQFPCCEEALSAALQVGRAGAAMRWQCAQQRIPRRGERQLRSPYSGAPAATG